MGRVKVSSWGSWEKIKEKIEQKCGKDYAIIGMNIKKKIIIIKKKKPVNMRKKVMVKKFST